MVGVWTASASLLAGPGSVGGEASAAAGLPGWVWYVAGGVVGIVLVVLIVRAILRSGGGAERQRIERRLALLVRSERFEEAGDLQSDMGDLQAALASYERARAWAKASTAARILDRPELATKYRERALSTPRRGGEDLRDPSPGARADAVDVVDEPLPESVAVAAEGVAYAGPPPEDGISVVTSKDDVADAAEGLTGIELTIADCRATVDALVSQVTTHARRDTYSPPGTPPEALPDGGQRYTIEVELGRGGMAVVYQAHDRLLGRPVAIKLLPAAMSRQGEMVDIFYREARAAAKLNHPSIVTIYDLGVLHSRPFISMELIDGEDVFRLLEKSGPLAIGQAVWVALKTAQALEYAHRRGLVHRDVKPANLMVTTDAALKVTDFGLARLVEPDQRTTEVCGTPAYMAPEQLAGAAVDARADVFGLSAALYEMLTAKLPFGGYERKTPPAPPSAHRPEIPAALDEVVLAGLAEDPEARPASAFALAVKLRAALDPTAPS